MSVEATNDIASDDATGIAGTRRELAEVLVSVQLGCLAGLVEMHAA